MSPQEVNAETGLLRLRARRFMLNAWLWHTITAVQAERDFALTEIQITCSSAPFDAATAEAMLTNRIQHLTYLQVQKAEQISRLLQAHHTGRAEA